MPTEPSISYPENFTVGTLVSNEAHRVGDLYYRNFPFIIPEYAPFYTDGIVVRYQADSPVASVTLVQDIDYYLVLPYIAASRSIGKPLYGAIAFTDSTIVGDISLSYRTLGGTWTANRSYVIERLGDQLYNPKMVSWDSVTDVQTTFPPKPHSLAIDKTYGMRELIESINGLPASIVEGRDQAAFVKHILRTNNPHATTKAQVGLGLVENLSVVTPTEITNRTRIRKYVTMDMLLDLLSTYSIGPVGPSVKATLTMDAYAVQEGDTVHGIVNTDGLIDGSKLYWVIVHDTSIAADFISP